MEEHVRQDATDESRELVLEAELSLIADEEKAARRLIEAQARLKKELRKLRKAQSAAQKRSAAVAEAERKLELARERRIAGIKDAIIVPLLLPQDPIDDKARPPRE